MTSSDSHNPLHKKWIVGKREIIYIVAGILICIYMLFFYFNEIKKEEKFQKHIDREHGHIGS